MTDEMRQVQPGPRPHSMVPYTSTNSKLYVHTVRNGVWKQDCGPNYNREWFLLLQDSDCKTVSQQNCDNLTSPSDNSVGR